MKKWLNTLVILLLILGMLLGLCLIVMIIANRLPFGGALMLKVDGDPWRGVVSSGLAVAAIAGGEWIACTLLLMMRSLNDDPFLEQNVLRLRTMGFTALGVMGLCLLTLCFRAVPLLVVGALPVGMCGLFSLVLSQVFSKAVAVKQENDLTV